MVYTFNLVYIQCINLGFACTKTAPFQKKSEFERYETAHPENCQYCDFVNIMPP